MNLVRDGSFTIGTGGRLPTSWNLSGGKASVGADFDRQTEGGVSLRVENLPGRLSKLSQVVPVKPGSELLFTARVKSAGRVVATVGALRMSYHKQGQWQQLVGLVRTGNASSVTINFDISDLGGAPEGALVDKVALVPFRRPDALSRKYQPASTRLVSEGKPQATIVYPAAPAVYRELALEVQAAVHAKTGVTLPVLSDTEATLPDAPNLAANLTGQNLVLLGRLGINRALWPAYNRFLAASDGYYPGGNGFEVRTASNVMRNGKDHLVLGASNEAGARRAVQRFVAQLKSLPATGNSLDVPWLLDVELGGECLEAMKSHDGAWTANPLDVTLPKIEPGYGTVRRWYENAMGYYWTGWPTYQKRTRELLEPVLADSSYTHHYIAEFFVRTWDMVDDAPFLADKREAVDRLLFSNLLDMQTDKGDLSWMTTFSPPYDSVAVVNRHQIAPWAADLALADFFHDYINLPSPTKDLVEFRRSEKDSFFSHLAATRWGASLPDLPMAEGEEETAQTLLRYALERGDYRLFQSGRARNVAQVERLSPLTGSWVRPAGGIENKSMFGILASYYRDGRYLTLRRTLSSTRPFMNRYLAGIHAYEPGEELTPASTDSMTGVLVPPVMAHRLANLTRLEGARFASPVFPPAQVFEFGAFRSGFEREDDFVSLTGVAGGQLPGVFASFISGGTDWLPGAGGVLNPASDRYFDLNAVSVIRTDTWQPDAKPYTAAARLVASGNMHRSGAIAFAMEPFAGTDWQRSVVWLSPGVYAVRDNLRARATGEYQISVNWAPVGAGQWKDGVWTSTVRTGNLRITPLGTGFSVPQPHAKSLRHISNTRLEKGQAVTATTLLQARKGQEEGALLARQLEDGALAIGGPGQNTQLVVWEPRNWRGIESDAHCIVLGADRIRVLHCSRLSFNGKVLLQSERPISAEIPLTGTQVRIDAPAGTKQLQLMGKPVALDPEASPAVPVSLDTRELAVSLRPLLSTGGAIPAATVWATGATAGTAAPNQTAAAATPVQGWKETWSYSGLRLPAPVAGVKFIEPDIVDLGRVVDLAAIDFPARTSGAWTSRALPQEFRFAVPDALGKMPAPGSEGWKKITASPVWKPGARTGNYGESVPVEQDSQYLPLQNVRARYIQTENPAQLRYLDRNTLGLERRLRVRPLVQDGARRWFLSPDFWPLFAGRPTPQDQVALLDAQGKEIYCYGSTTNLQVAEPLPLAGKDNPVVTLATVDGKVRTLSSGGKVERELDLYALHQDFNRKHGRENTRQPAGGFTMPFALGTWSQEDKKTEIVVARYGNFSFLEPETGSLKGVLYAIGYSQPAILPHGIDFDGDGREEQIALGRGTLRHLSGPLDRRIEQPTGNLFYPQIYHDQRVAEPAWENHINGARPLMLAPVSTGGQTNGTPRFVLVARANYFGLYDAVKRRWGATWTPQVGITGLAVLEAKADSLRILASTEDGLLWEARFTDPTKPPAEFRSISFPHDVRRISASDSVPGKALLSCADGLYLFDAAQAGKSHLQWLASGSFVDAAWDETDRAVVAATESGQVQRLAAP